MNPSRIFIERPVASGKVVLSFNSHQRAMCDDNTALCDTFTR